MMPSSFLSFLLQVVAIVLFSRGLAANAEAIVVVNCSSTDDVIVLSHTTYVLNCTQPQPGYRSFIETTGNSSNANLSHCAVHTVGGNTLPRLVLGPGGSVLNLTLQLTNLYIPAAASLPMLGTPLLSVCNRSRLDGMHMSLENVTLYLPNNQSHGGLFTIGPESSSASQPPPSQQQGDRVDCCAPIMDVRFSIVNSSITFNFTTAGPTGENGPSLLLLKHHSNLSGLVIAIANSTVTGAGAASGVLLNIVGSAFSFFNDDGGSTIEHVNIIFKASTIRQSWPCGSGDRWQCFGPNEVYVSPLTGILLIDHPRQRDVYIAVSDVQWNASTATFAPPHRISTELFMIILQADVYWLRAVIDVERVSSELRSIASVILIAIRCTNASEVSLKLAQVNMFAWVRGPIVSIDRRRVASVLAFYSHAVAVRNATLLHGAALQLTDVSADVHVVSGETELFAIASSRLTTVAAGILVVSGGLRNTTIRFRRCHLTGSVAGGTAPTYDELPITFFTATAALVNFDSAGANVEGNHNLVVTAEGSSVQVELGFSITPVTLMSTVLAISSCSVCSMLANCTDCRFDFLDVRAEVVGMSFESLPPRSDSLYFFNVTAVFQVSNYGGLLSSILSGNPLTALVPPELLEGLFQRLTFIRVHMLLQNTTAAQAPQLALDPFDLDVLALVILASEIDDSDVVISTHATQLPSPRTALSLPAAIAALGSTAVWRTTVNVTGASRGLSALLQATAGPLTVVDSSLIFHSVAVFGGGGGGVWVATKNPWTAIAAYGGGSNTANTMLSSGIVTINTSCSIARCSFANCASLINQSRVLLASLTLGCNTWDGVALPLSAVGVPLERVDYPKRTFDGTVCKGVPASHTHSLPSPSASVSESVVVNHKGRTLSSALLLLSTSTVVTFASALGPTGPRAAIGSVQGVVGLMRLSALCRKNGRINGRQEVAEVEEGEEEVEEGTSIMDNPLQLGLHVDPTMPQQLRFALGAVVGNTIFVVAVAIVLHGCAWWRNYVERSNRMWASNGAFVRLLLDLAPQTLWPGCLLVPLGILLEPVVRVAVLLVALGGVSAGALGGVLLAAWLSVVVLVAYRLLRIRPFPMRTLRPKTSSRRRSAVASNHHDVAAPWRAMRVCVQLLLWSTVPSEVLSPPNRRAPHHAYASMLEAHYVCAYEPYKSRYVVFFAVEYGCAITLGIVLGVATSSMGSSTSSSSFACDVLNWCGWLVAVVCIGSGAAVACFHPFAVRGDTMATTVVQGLCAASAVAAALASDAESTNSTVADHLALAATFVELLAVVLGLVAGVRVRGMRRAMNTYYALGMQRGQMEALSSMARGTGPHLKMRRSRRIPEERAAAAPPAVTAPTYDTSKVLEALLALICEGRHQTESIPHMGGIDHINVC